MGTRPCSPAAPWFLTRTEARVDNRGGLKGKLLVASPTLVDPNFFRTVTLLFEHNDDGAVGVVLNRMLDVDVAEYVPDWASLLAAPANVFFGGPVEREMAVGVAWRPESAHAPDWSPVLDGVGIIDLSLGPEEVAGVEELRVFSGYAGWGRGQLEAELLLGSWIVVDARTSDAFELHPEGMWDRVLLRQRDSRSFYARFPLDLRSN